MNYIEAYDIGSAWREVMSICVKNGYDFVVKSGSYKEQIRRQLDCVMIKITNPGARPLAPILPAGMPPPTTDENIDEYFANYIMGKEIRVNEQYTYGSYIVPQVNRAVQLLLDSEGNSNQACIAIGDKSSIHLADPPCLRTITFKVVKGKLNATVFFRSWDLFTGLPENLGGIQLLKEYVLQELAPLGIEDGDLIAYSDGLHLYEQYFDLVNVLNIEKIKVGEDVLKDKKREVIEEKENE